jgi:hypothetical protein
MSELILACPADMRRPGVLAVVAMIAACGGGHSPPAECAGACDSGGRDASTADAVTPQCANQTVADGSEAPGSVDVTVNVEFGTPLHALDGTKAFGIAHYPAQSERSFYLPRVAAAGIHTVRNDLFLQDVIPASKCPDLATWNLHKDDPTWWNSLDWAKVDDWIIDAKQHGFRTVGILAYVPAFLSSNPTDANFMYRVPHKGDTATWHAWGELCAKVIDRYKTQLDAVEVYNEAEFFAQTTAAGYAQNVDAAPDLYYNAQGPIRAGTSASLGGPATFIQPGIPNALDKLVADPRTTSTSADFAAIHVYFSDLAVLMQQLDIARWKVDGTHGYPASKWAGKPLWVTEWFTGFNDVSQKTAWFGFVLGELLRRDMSNVVYDYKNLLAASAPSSWVLPWKGLFYANVTEDPAAQVVSTTYAQGVVATQYNSVGILESDGRRVVMTSNNSASYRPTLWRLKGVPAPLVPRCRFWTMSPTTEAGACGTLSSDKSCFRVSADEVDVKLWVEPNTTMVFRVE